MLGDAADGDEVDPVSAIVEWWRGDSAGASSLSGFLAVALTATAARIASREKSSSMAISAPAAMACCNSDRFSTSTSIGLERAAWRRYRAAIETRGHM